MVLALGIFHGGLLIIPVGWLFPGSWGSWELWPGSRVLPMRPSCPLGFILWVSLSGTLLVVFILGMVYEVLLIVPVGMDLSGLCPGSKVRVCARSLPSGIYAAAELQWHFACCFDFGSGLWGVVDDSCGGYGSFLGWDDPFQAVGGLVGCV